MTPYCFYAGAPHQQMNYNNPWGRKEVKPGILSSTFHFPENMLNNITSSISDSEAMCPEYKVVACTIRKSKGKYKAKADK